jgi:hypothetical protein
MQLPRAGAVVPNRRRPVVARPPTIPGIALCRALAPDGAGPPWRGRDVTTGQEVVLRPLPAATGAQELTELPDHPHLAGVAAWKDADGRQYAATALAANGGLDALLLRRGPLTAGETTMVVVAVGRALATLHAAGRVHGSVTARSVLVDAAMRPLLDASLCRPAPSTAGDGTRLAAEDVRALGALAVECLGDDVPPSLRPVLSAATDPDPDLRPSAVELVRMAAEAVPPEGLRLTGHRHGLDADESLPPGPSRVRLVALPGRRGKGASIRRRHAGPRRRSAPVGGVVRPLTALAAVLLLLVAVGAGVVWARSSQGAVLVSHRAPRSAPVALPPSSPPSGSPDWSLVLRDLDLARAAAFANADATVLASVDAPRSPALGSDRAAVQALADAGVQAKGYAVSTSAVRVVTAAADDVRLDVVDTRGGYTVVDARGAAVGTQPARPSQHWHVHLVRVGGTWLVHDVTPG